MAILLAFPLPANPLRSVLFIPENGLLELLPGNPLYSHFHANFDTIRLFSGGSFGFLGLFNLFLAHTNVFYGRTIGADQKEHTLSD